MKNEISTKIIYKKSISKNSEFTYKLTDPKSLSVLHDIELKLERDNWNLLLSQVVTNHHKIEDLIIFFNKSMKKSEYYNHTDKYEDFFRKIHTTYNMYLNEAKNKKLNEFHSVSTESLLQLVRFIPDFPERNLKVYLDEMNGCFGVTIKVKSKEKPVLNLLMRENKEVIFSFIKRKKKIIKITGRAYFNDQFQDSSEIQNIIKMISECKI